MTSGTSAAVYFVRDRGGSAAERADVLVSRSRYYAVGVDTLADLLGAAGFAAVERFDGVCYQPVLLGR